MQQHFNEMSSSVAECPHLTSSVRPMAAADLNQLMSVPQCDVCGRSAPHLWLCLYPVTLNVIIQLIIRDRRWMTWSKFAFHNSDYIKRLRLFSVSEPCWIMLNVIAPKVFIILLLSDSRDCVYKSSSIIKNHSVIVIKRVFSISDHIKWLLQSGLIVVWQVIYCEQLQFCRT